MTCVYRKLKLGHNGDAVILGEAHLRRILGAYFTYYNVSRTHCSLDKDQSAKDRAGMDISSSSNWAREWRAKWSRDSRRIDPINSVG